MVRDEGVAKEGELVGMMVVCNCRTLVFMIYNIYYIIRVYVLGFA